MRGPENILNIICTIIEYGDTFKAVTLAVNAVNKFLKGHPLTQKRLHQMGTLRGLFIRTIQNPCKGVIRNHMVLSRLYAIDDKNRYINFMFNIL